MFLITSTKNKIDQTTHEDLNKFCIPYLSESQYIITSFPLESQLYPIMILFFSHDDEIPSHHGSNSFSSWSQLHPILTPTASHQYHNSFPTWSKNCYVTDKLDGVKGAKKRITEQHSAAGNKPQSIQDWLELSKDYDVRKSEPGKKRVSDSCSG